VVLSRNGKDYPIVVGGSNVRAGTAPDHEAKLIICRGLQM